MRGNKSMSLKLKSRKQVKVGNFKGVDFSSSPLLVSNDRGVRSTNLIHENGVNRKRNGWVEKYRVGKEKVGGIFEATLDGVKTILVYAGRKFYRIVGDDVVDITHSSTKMENQVDVSRLTDNRCQMFISQNRCYFIGCGDYLTYGKYGSNYELRRVEDDEMTFIPTTTTHIYSDEDIASAENAENSENSESGESDKVKSLASAGVVCDGVNLLTGRRKNTLVGSKANSTYTLDCFVIDGDYPVIVKCEVEEEMNGARELKTKIFSNIGAFGYESLSEYYSLFGNGLNETNDTLFISEDITTFASGEKSELYDDVGNKVGSIDHFNGKITFDTDTTPYKTGEANIVVTFGCKVEGVSQKITESMFGIMFGENGNPDRLFLSGNKDYPNMDFYSEKDNLTYFQDSSCSVVGSSESKIVGYSRLGDGTLALHKEVVNGEASIYFRSGDFETNESETSNSAYVSGHFPISAGTIGEGLVSPYTCANFCGDKVYLSRNGLYGIELSKNYSSAERYSRERSGLIKVKLQNQSGLRDAVGVVYRNRYYLAVDGVCYVADGRLTSESTTDVDSFNYEWHYWDNMPVRVWGIIDDNLYFGTNDGRICTFDDKFSDRLFEKTNLGELYLDYQSNTFTYSKYWGIKNNDIIKFNSDIFKVKFDVGQIVKVENGRIYLSDDDILACYAGSEVYVDGNLCDGLEVNQKYYIEDVNLSDCSFTLVYENGEKVSVSESGFRICENLREKELIVTNLTQTTFQVKFDGLSDIGASSGDVEKESNIIDFVKYNNSVAYQTPLATFITLSNVVASWYSPILDLGSTQTMKTLLSLTISSEPITTGQVEFGYTTKNAEEFISSKGVSMFDFENIDFNNFTFDSAFASSYTVDIKDDFNFIQFFFKSDNDKSCAIHSITITYKLNSKNRGVQ